IEDAAVLASCLAAKPDDIPAAFRDYEAARKARVTRVVREASENGRNYHWSGPAAIARDLMLRSSSPLKLLSRYDWLYSWQPPALPDLGG
ncbi:MAG: FAD-binding monooxygenase, partial [Hyphomicrobiales bacterium]|nr:FAD-binding monooxygenase [Hyphomicrobiales bacterium]